MQSQACACLLVLLLPGACREVCLALQVCCSPSGLAFLSLFAMSYCLRALLVVVLLFPVLAMQRGNYRRAQHSSSWRGGGYSNWQGSQDRSSNMHGRLDRIEMLVEEVAKGKKKRHSKKKSKTSSSPSSSSSTPDRKKAKKQKKEKKSKCAGRPSKSEEVSGTLDEADKKELQEFRRQAEMTKLRAEVRAAMEAERGDDSVPAASTPKVSRTKQVAAPEFFTPKTCRIIAAESRVYQDGETKQLITEASSWEQVSDQLSALPVAEVKALLKQFCPHEQLPRSRADIVRDVVSELKSRAA